MRYIITLFLAILLTSVGTAQIAHLQIPDITAECGDIINIPVQVGEKDFGKYNSIQFSLTWNKNALEFQKTFTGLNQSPLFLNLNNFGPNSPTFDNDTLTFVWFSGTGVELPSGTNLFGLNFKVLGGGVPNSSISFINFTPINISGVVNDIPFTNIPNVITKSGLITVHDNTPPVLQCPKDITVLAPPGAGKAIVDNIFPLQASDNCGVAFLGYNFNGATSGIGAGDPSGSVFNAGLTTVSYTINDASNNFNNCSFNILVIDTASTIFSIEADDVTINCTSQKIAVPVTTNNFKDIVGLQFGMKWNNNILELDSIVDLNSTLNLNSSNFGPSPADNDTLTFAYSGATGVTLPPNDTLFTLFFSAIGGTGCSNIEFISVPNLPIQAYESGNPNPVEIPVDTIFGSVCLTDNVNPTIVCPPNQIIKVANGVFSAVVNNISPAVDDNCGVKSLSYVLSGATVGSGGGDASGKTFFFGVTNVVYTVEDFAGNTANCNFNVVVQDTVLRLIPTSGLAYCDSSKYAINVTVQNFNEIIALQFGMKWDPTVLQFDTVGNFDPNLMLDPNSNFGPSVINDTLTFAWFDFKGLNLPDNTILFTVYFDVVGNAGTLSKFEFINTPTTIIEASNSNGVTGVEAFDALVNVFDFQPPSITCPKNQTFSVPQGSNGLVVNNIGLLSVSDNCAIKQVTYNLTGSTFGSGVDNASGTFFNSGKTTVNYTVEDFGGNKSTCFFEVNVLLDTFTLYVDTIQAQCSNGILSIDINVLNFTDIASLQFGMSWDDAIIKFDSVGNFNPGLNLTGIFQPNSNFGPLVIDDSLTFAWNNYTGVTIPNGGTIFTLYFTPVSNITTTTFFNFINYPTTPIEVSVKGNPPHVIPYKVFNGVINIDDTEPPVITCPKDITVGTDQGLCSAQVQFNKATAIDNCDPLVEVSAGNPPSGSIFQKGTTSVTFIAKDDFNNTSTCSFKITVVDDEAPILVCPQNLSADSDSGVCGTNIQLPQLIDVSDNCDFNINVTANHNLIEFYPVGKTTVTYAGTDLAGNKGTCTFVITVKDLELPVLHDCPKDTIVTPDINIQNQCFAQVGWIKPTATDNCPNVIIDSDIFPPSLFPPGNTIVHYIAIDASGNTATCQFTVSVQVPNSGFNDCPADITMNATVSTKDSCGAEVFWTEPYFIDACGDTLDVYSNYGPGEFFPVGTTQVIYISAENSVILDTCTFNVTVIGQTPVLVNCPDDMTIGVLDTVCGNYPTWTTPFGINECGDTIIMSSNIQPDSFLNLGVHVVTYTAPNLPNFPICTFTVNVIDNIKPQHGLCPPDQVIMVANDSCGATVVWTDPIFTDNCDNDLFVVSSDTSGSFLPIGHNIITYVAIDDAGNVDTCSFDIFVREDIPPVLSPCPADITLNSLPNACGNFVFWDPPTATDNCDTSVLVTASTGPGFYQAGVSIITYTATDDAGNTVTCSFKITILETEPPVINCPQDITIDGNGNVLNDLSDFISDVTLNECNNVVVFFDQLIAVDNCNPNLVAQQISPVTPVSGGEFLPGTYTFVYKATDAQNNSDSCSFKVTILPYVYNADGTPNVVCIGDSVILTSPQVPGATGYFWSGPDNFSDTGQVVSAPIKSFNGLGDYIINVVLGNCNNKTYSDTIHIDVIPPPDAINDLDSLGNIDSNIVIIMLNNDIAFQSINVKLGTTSSGFSILNQNNTITYFPDPNFVGFATIGYTICAVDCPGSCDSATILLKVTDDSQCIIPNFISPNDDELNDVLFIKCLESDKYPTNKLFIYNEWGHQIFAAAPYQNNWFGTLETLDGKKVPDGTYFYIFYESDYDQNPRHGYITILR